MIYRQYFTENKTVCMPFLKAKFNLQIVEFWDGLRSKVSHWVFVFVFGLGRDIASKTQSSCKGKSPEVSSGIRMSKE